jgi:hypothetical protein
MKINVWMVCTLNSDVPPASSPGGLSYIEQLTAAVCVRPRRPWLCARSDVLRAVLFFQPRCRSWSCPACAETNRALWVVRAAYAARVWLEETDALEFITLTSHRALSAARSVQVFRNAWPQLRKRWRRACSGAGYIQVPERHRSGKLHVHMIVNGAVGTRWWKDNSAACGMGYISDEERVREAARAAWYIGKELSKMLGGLSWPVGFRRVRTSRNFPRAPAPAGAGDWTFALVGSADRLPAAREAARREGYAVIEANHAEAWRIIDLVESMYGVESL